MILRRRAAAGPSSGPEHPGLLLHPATPGSGVEAGDGDGAPPRFADGPADVLLRRLELTVRRRLDGLLGPRRRHGSRAATPDHAGCAPCAWPLDAGWPY